MKELTRQRYIGTLTVCGLLVVVAILLAPGIGNRSGELGLVRAWQTFFHSAHDSVDYQIAFNFRMPRTILALLVGFTLSLCGAVFQILFRNALATPYTLGISSGGSLGALIAIKFGWERSFAGMSSVSIASFAGALVIIGIVFLYARGERRLTTNELLLAGVTLGLFCSAMMMLVTYLASVRETFEVVRWMMGSLDPIGNVQAKSMLPMLVPAWVVLLLSARALNQYSMGDELAASRGVNVARLQVACILVASLATAAVVAVCGPIGFVGLVVPHLAALVVGRDCRILLPAGALLGAVFMAGCDWISQLAMVWASAVTGRELGYAVLPIGVVTAVIGVPIFLILLQRRST